jgi:hypothetical protein
VLSYLLDKEIKLRDHPFWFDAVVQPALLTQLSRNEAAGSMEGQGDPALALSDALV